MLDCKPMSQEELLLELDQVSFAAYDLLLYLDSHPEDQKALGDYHKFSSRRNELLQLYARDYSPLTMDSVNFETSHCWDWVMQPWPWENKKGRC